MAAEREREMKIRNPPPGSYTFLLFDIPFIFKHVQLVCVYVSRNHVSPSKGHRQKVRQQEFWHNPISAQLFFEWMNMVQAKSHTHGKNTYLKKSIGLFLNLLPQCPIKMRVSHQNESCLLALSLLHNSREDGGKQGSSHFDEKLSF